MHARHDHDRMNPDRPLTAALRSLPTQSPTRDLWPMLAARARRRQHRRGWLKGAMPLAAAAVIVLAVLTVILMTARPPAATHHAIAFTPHATAVPMLVQLRQRSRRLQAWTRQLGRDGPPLDGRALARVVTLQDRIGLVDVALNASRSTTQRVSLWRQRIVLLQQLAITRVGNAHHYVADARL